MTIRVASSLHIPTQGKPPKPSSLTKTIHAFRLEARQLIVLMLPILLTQFAQAGFGLIDTIMSGHVSAGDLASVALGVSFWLPLVLLLGGILQATTPLIAEAFGAQTLDPKSIQRIPTIARQALWLALGVGLAGALILNLLAAHLALFQIPDTLIPKTRLFLIAVSAGFPGLAFYTALRCYTEALGRPRPVTIISLFCLLLAVPLNVLFIYGFQIGPWTVPALGGAGCGFSTAILQWLMLTILALYLSLSHHYRQIRIFDAWEQPRTPIIMRIARLGFPIGIAIFFEVTLFCLGAVILTPFGPITIAAHQVALSMTSQFFMIPLSLSTAITIRMGQLYGQQNAIGMRKLRRVGLSLGCLLALCTMLIITLTRHQIALLYSNDPYVRELAASLMLYAMAYQLVDALQVTTAGCLRGMQDTQVPMWMTFIAYWLVGFPTGYLLSRVLDHGAPGFWVGLIVGLAAAAGLLNIRLRIQERRIAKRWPAQSITAPSP